MRVGLYARVSTLDKGQDVDLQLRDLREYAGARGWEVFREYVDEGQSGAKDRRPALDELLTDARRRKIDVVAVWRLDRLGRSLKHLIGLLDELHALGVGFISLGESLDFTTPAGRLMFHLLGAFAQFERDIIRERVKAGMANAKAKGKPIGRRPKIALGDLRTAVGLRGRGESIRGIAGVLGVSKSAVHKALLSSAVRDAEKSLGIPSADPVLQGPV